MLSSQRCCHLNDVVISTMLSSQRCCHPNDVVISTTLSSQRCCHPKQREGPGFLPAPSRLPAQANTQVPRVARNDKPGGSLGIQGRKVTPSWGRNGMSATDPTPATCRPTSDLWIRSTQPVSPA